MIFKITQLFKLFKASGTVHVEAETVEKELTEIGREFERCRLNRESIHDDAVLSDRYIKALRWAHTSKFGDAAINFFLEQGSQDYRHSHRRQLGR